MDSINLSSKLVQHIIHNLDIVQYTDTYSRTVDIATGLVILAILTRQMPVELAIFQHCRIKMPRHVSTSRD